MYESREVAAIEEGRVRLGEEGAYLHLPALLALSQHCSSALLETNLD